MRQQLAYRMHMRWQVLAFYFRMCGVVDVLLVEVIQ